MKRFLSRVNRGLLLGGVLLVGLVCFIIIKNLVFRSELPGIRETVRASFDAMLQTNFTPNDGILGLELTEQEKETMQARLEKVLVDYWDPNGDEISYYIAHEVREAYAEYLSAPYVMFEEITLNLSDDDIQITPNGTNYAKVTVSIENLSAVYFGYGDMLFCGLPVWSRQPDDSFEATSWYRGNYAGYLEMELHRVNGQWRICGMSGYVDLKSEIEMGGKT